MALKVNQLPAKSCKCELCTGCEYMVLSDGNYSNMCIFGGPYLGLQDTNGKPVSLIVTEQMS